MEKKKEGVSRQTLWQRKHRAMGLCVVCSEPAYKGWRCVKHYEQHKIVMRLRYIPRVRGRYDVGGSVEYSDVASAQLDTYERNGFGHLPVCIAKTHLSISGDPALRGAPTGHTLSVREVRASVGAGFVYPICGDMRTMPGLSKEPAAAIIDILENGDIINLS